VIPLSEKTPIEKIIAIFVGVEMSADLALVIVFLAASVITIYLPFLNSTLIRVVLALPAIFFIPGYCLIAALFPKKGDISIPERIMLSIGSSIAIVSLIGFGLNFTPLGIRLDPIIILISLVTWLMVLIVHYKRALLPHEERFKISVIEITGRIRQEIVPQKESRVDRFLSVFLVLLMLITIITTGYVLISPKEGERFSEFFLLGEKQTAANYPDPIVVGHNYPIFIGVGNHEFRNMNYTIEVWTFSTEFDSEFNTTSINVMDPIDNISVTLAHNETRIIPYSLLVKNTSNNRVEFLLFNESVPGHDITGSDRINKSYRDLHLWVTGLDR
jgi:uncharacterized membrane protein